MHVGFGGLGGGLGSLGDIDKSKGKPESLDELSEDD